MIAADVDTVSTSIGVIDNDTGIGDWASSKILNFEKGIDDDDDWSAQHVLLVVLLLVCVCVLFAVAVVKEQLPATMGSRICCFDALVPVLLFLLSSLLNPVPLIFCRCMSRHKSLSPLTKRR